jgi:hypothetical protein
MWAHVWHVGWIDPTWDVVIVSIHIMHVISLDLRLLYVLKMWNDLLRDYQILLRNWVVIQVVLGFVKKHTVRHKLGQTWVSLTGTLPIIACFVGRREYTACDSREEEALHEDQGIFTRTYDLREREPSHPACSFAGLLCPCLDPDLGAPIRTL